MKEFGLIILMLLLVLSGLYITRQERVISQNNEQVAELQKTNKEYKVTIVRGSEKNQSMIRNAQRIIDKTAKERDELNRELTTEKSRVQSLRTAIKSLSKSFKEELKRRDAEESGGADIVGN